VISAYKETKMPETARYIQLLMIAKALAKVEMYDNPVFKLLFQELKHIMLLLTTNKES
jgi:hypothetical protein